MFCRQCGQALPAGANFCSTCGTPVNANVFTASPYSTIYRPRALRMIAGVCAAFHLRYGWDLVITRILMVLMGILLFPVGEIVYVVSWLLIPEEVPLIPQAGPVAQNPGAEPHSTPSGNQSPL
jgi:phage shock protein C